ncbi:MAG: putative DNA binding domain-containing protein [Spirochaetales bacterium]|nr:putative DNA binding domain-containing protein [Spirochaetales bacterium]
MQYTHESEFEEFKESTSQLNRATESLAAMLNKNGRGKVIFGIRDDGSVCGITLGNKIITEISRGISEQIRPSVVPRILFEEREGKTIIIVEVEGTNKPYSARGEYRIRSGDENRKIEPEQLKDLLLRNSFELITSMESFDQDLRLTQLKQLYITNGLTVNEETFERNTGLLTADGKYNVLAEILSDFNDCSIKVVRFAGKDKQNMIIRNEYGYKCMLLAMQQAYQYVESLNETRVILGEGLERKETKLFDSSCFKEAWTNACLHNRWAKNIPPAIYIFDDRLEIISTGGLPVDFSEDEFFSGISHPVNLKLQKIMGQLNMVEQTGHGVPLIVSKYGRQAFDLGENHITVRIPFSFEISSTKKDYSMLNRSQESVYMLVSETPTIRTDEIAQKTDLSISRINQIIKELKGMDKLERKGSKKLGYWETH